MVRIKVPYGSMTPEQLEMLGHVADTLQPGLGPHHHPPERPVPLRPARAGPRAAAGPGVGRPHHPGGVRRHRPQRPGCHLAGACPFEVLDISPWAEADLPALPPPPLRPAAAPQVQDQLLGLRHRLRPGHVQRRRARRRGPPLARTARSSPASGSSWPAASGANPHPAQALEEFTPREELLATIEASCGPSTTTATATTSCGPG